MSEEETVEFEEEEALSARERWASDEWTQKIAKEARIEAHNALTELVQYCASTIDPLAARLHAAYVTKKAIAGKFDRIEGKTAKGLP